MVELDKVEIGLILFLGSIVVLAFALTFANLASGATPEIIQPEIIQSFNDSTVILSSSTTGNIHG